MALLNLNTDFITEETLRSLAEKTNITYLSPGSKYRLLLDIMNNKLGLQVDQFDDNISSAFIRNASGILLDFVGEIWGSQRALQKKAEVDKEEQNFYLYTFESDFGEINAGQEIVIPARSLEIFNTTDPDQFQVVYTNTKNIVLDPAKNKIYFSAEAEGFGTDYNVGANSMVSHNFTNYADYLNRTLFVNNDISITYGADTQSDENYRFQIQQQATAGEAANYSAIRLSLLSIAGISDVFRVKYPRGVGTADWIIKAVTPEVPQRLIDQCQEAIDSVEGSGLENIATAPITIGTQLIFSTTYRARYENDIKDQIKETVKRNLIDYVNNLGIGEDLIVDQLLKTILNADNRILSVGSPDRLSNFERINIYKRSAISTSKVRRTIIKDYVTDLIERVIVEPSLIDPIVIIDNN